MGAPRKLQPDARTCHGEAREGRRGDPAVRQARGPERPFDRLTALSGRFDRLAELSGRFDRLTAPSGRSTGSRTLSAVQGLECYVAALLAMTEKRLHFR